METFIISDTHFGHKGVTQFLRDDGTKLRPWDSVEKMDEALVANWNKVVSPKDKVYHLGDVAINRKALSILDRLNGKKLLVKGNHDIFKIEDYTKYFYDVRAYKVLPDVKVIMSHIPIHPHSLERWKLNIHGHLHHQTLGDPRYVSACVERIDYAPQLLDYFLRLQG